MKTKLLKLYEQFFPLIFSTVIISYLLLFDYSVINSISFSNLSNSIINVFSVLLGFLLTILTLINTIDNIKMRIIKETGHDVILMRYLKNAIYFSFIILVISLLLPILNIFVFQTSLFGYTSLIQPAKILTKYLYLFLLFYSLLSTYRFIKLFIKLISRPIN